MMGGATAAARKMARAAQEAKANTKCSAAEQTGTRKGRDISRKGISMGSLRIGPVEILLGLIASVIAWGAYQKQNADAYVAQCAQRHERADYATAMNLCTSALAIYVSLNEYARFVGWKDAFWADVAQTTDNIGVVHMNLGNNAAALHYHQTALSLREQHLGSEHLDVAATRDNLGLVYRQMNDIDKALEYHKRALQIRINEVGPSDLATAASKTAIANIHYQNEEYKEALELYNEVLTMQVEMLGNDHLDVAATLQNIGTVLKHSDLNQSWERFETSLAIIVGIYGHKHRSVADTLNNMGGVRYAQV
jgi:tetratricopeptide (TPR) repeat protein